MSGSNARGISGDYLGNHVGIRIHSDVDGHRHGGIRDSPRWIRILEAGPVRWDAGDVGLGAGRLRDRHRAHRRLNLGEQRLIRAHAERGPEPQAPAAR